MGSLGPEELVKTWLSEFDDALLKQELSRVVGLFLEECFWRDFASFTWNLHTAESRDEIAEMLEATLTRTKPTGWEIDGEAFENGDMAEAFIKFETSVARGQGYLRLKGKKCWTLLTQITELKGHEEKSGVRRPWGAQHGYAPGTKTWLERKTEEQAELGYRTQPYCVVVGGGQAGITIGARLKQLGVPTIIVEKNEKPGDSWRNRYKSLCLHDPVWYDHFPYLPFPSNWPVFSPKDKLGDWLEAYTNFMELVYWGSTECKSSRYDSSEGRWEIVVERAGTEVILRPAQMILATGMSGMPHMPRFRGAESFQGVQCHSSKFAGGEEWVGKQCVVIGSNNSAHDICASLWENGAAQVTMVQKSSTHIVQTKNVLTQFGKSGYCENPPFSLDKTDLKFASVPHKLMAPLSIPDIKRIAEDEAEFYDRLRKVGFMLDFGDDGSGLFMKYLRRGSGYYIDVGASELVASGKIKLKSGVGVQEVKPKSLLLSDGTELPADVLIYATGYGPMNEWAAKLISQEVAEKVGKVWGLGSNTTKDPGPWERELRNMWKPTHQPGLWFHGGNIHQCRHYSLILGLQIKARMEGIPTPVYALPKVNHTT